MDWGFLWGMVEPRLRNLWNDKVLFYEFLFPCACGRLDLLTCVQCHEPCSAWEGPLSRSVEPGHHLLS